MTSTAAQPAKPSQRFGRFEMRRLLGKSARSMVWEANDPDLGRQVLLAMPRVAPAGDAALQRWLDDARVMARLSHPNLVPVNDVGMYQRLPFVSYERAQDSVTLAQRLQPDGHATLEVGRWAVQALEGLAYAHDAGVSHRDLQMHMLRVDERGHLQVLGLSVAPMTKAIDALGPLQARQEMIERDVMAVGLAMYHLLAARAALDEPDLGSAIERMTPLGDATVRLPRELPQPVPEGFRAVINRCLDKLPQQRFRHARTLGTALQEWVPSQRSSLSDSLPEQLLESVRRHGVLPALPDGAAIASRLLGMERQHVGALAQQALQDPATCLELLHQANSSYVRSAQAEGSGAVVTLRRAIAMIGLAGLQRVVQRQHAWPGPLDQASARALLARMERAQRAMRLALLLSPPGFDSEIVQVVTLLQELGSLLVHYHFPELARQMRALMAPRKPASPDEPQPPALDEAAAARKVLGLELEALALALLSHWGLDASMLALLPPLPTNQAVQVVGEDGLLRAVVSAAREAVSALAMPAERSNAALDRVAQRYAATLVLDGAKLRRLLREALAVPRAG